MSVGLRIITSWTFRLIIAILREYRMFFVQVYIVVVHRIYDPTNIE